MDRLASLGNGARRIFATPFWLFYRVVRMITRSWRRVMLVVWAMLGLMGTVTFTQFILEEALQQASFSCYHYRSAYKENPNEQILLQMEANLIKFEEIQEYAEWWNEWVGWVNPLTRGAFFQYNHASRMQLTAYQYWLEERRVVTTTDDGVIEVNFDRPCPRCNGTGTYKKYGSCFRCDGTGIETD